ncbi:MAG: NERD domain-containing protein [Chloroflexota bacterium]
MAVMIPDVPETMIENNGERMLYEAARTLPDEYTVLYSFKYRTGSEAEERPDEADFVVVHPALGYCVIEVKQGDVSYANGVFSEYKGGVYRPLAKDPVAQAEQAMYAILNLYKEKTGESYYPLAMRYAICFPECSKLAGDLPAHLKPGSILLSDDLDRLADAIERLFGQTEKHYERAATDLLINRVLAPRFRVFARLEEQISMQERVVDRLLTEEQERILAETELDKRKVFFGAAGTGKTFVAMEKARRLAAAGRRVLLTCFNRPLGRYFREQMPAAVVCQSFHDFLLASLAANGRSLQAPADQDPAASLFYNETLPELGFELFAGADPALRFDSIIVDEGQDFRENWIICLEAMLRSPADSEFYIFADPNQDLFGVNLDHLLRVDHSKHRLVQNLRNTETINAWIAPFVKEGQLKPRLRGGMPVSRHAWDTPLEEKRLIESEVGRLVSQGVPLRRILILSPNRIEHSSLAGAVKIKEWPLAVYPDTNPHGLQYATIRSFKGLEADIVFLIGLEAGKRTLTDADIYVGASRAKFLLYLFHSKDNPPRCLAN